MSTCDSAAVSVLIICAPAPLCVHAHGLALGSNQACELARTVFALVTVPVLAFIFFCLTCSAGQGVLWYPWRTFLHAYTGRRCDHVAFVDPVAGVCFLLCIGGG